MQIFCFGDSITYGGTGSWVYRLRKAMEEKGEKETASVYNLGIKGDCSRDILNRLKNELEVREDSETETVILFQVGINDSLIIKTKNDNQIQIEEFKQNLEKIWFEAKKHTENIVFLGLTPVIDSEVDPLDWDTNKAYRTEEVRQYEDRLHEFCREKDLAFVELYDRVMENGYGDLLRDGVHPNGKGHKLIFQRVLRRLDMEEIV